MKIKKYILKIKEIIDKYEINLIAASTSFYMIVAIFSLLILIIQFHNYLNTDNNFIINKIIELLNPYYLESFENVIPIFSLNSFSPILFFNLIWSSSKYINGFNKASDIIYSTNKKRNFIKNRISSIIILFIIICILFLEIITVLFANIVIKYIVENIIKSMVIYSIIQLFIELFLIFSVIILINKFVPPIKIKLKNIYLGSLISTVVIYIILLVFLLLIKLFEMININFNVLTIISFFFIMIYAVNYCLVAGLILNYYLQKNPKFNNIINGNTNIGGIL